MLGSANGEATPLLSRLEERSLLTSLLNDVATRGQALVISGEPGIGKSRLLSMCQRMARERGMAVSQAVAAARKRDSWSSSPLAPAVRRRPGVAA
jgi:ABC-type transport system involved in cytochrome c biogenesis ATPase subunit